MATIDITGRIVKDVKLEKTPNGKDITSFSVASNRKYTDDKGIQHDEVDFYHITCWKELAMASQFLKKGMKVRVRGYCQYKNWIDQDEVPRITFEVTATDISQSIFTIYADQLKKKEPERTIGARTYQDPEPVEKKKENQEDEKLEKSELFKEKDNESVKEPENKHEPEKQMNKEQEMSM